MKKLFLMLSLAVLCFIANSFSTADYQEPSDTIEVVDQVSDILMDVNSVEITSISFESSYDQMVVFQEPEARLSEIRHYKQKVEPDIRNYIASLNSQPTENYLSKRFADQIRLE